MKDATEIVCQRNSSETAQQNFVKLCSCEEHACTLYICISTWYFGSFFLSELCHFWTLKFGLNERYYWNRLSAQLLQNRSTEFRETLKLWRTYHVDVHLIELPYCTWSFLVTSSFHGYQNICPCDLGHLWKDNFVGFYVSQTHLVWLKKGYNTTWKTGILKD